MTDVVISKEIAAMWQSFQRLCSIWYTLENPEAEINDSIVDVIAEDPSIGASAPALAMWGNYLKFMLSSQKDGVVFPPTEDTFLKWYNGKKAFA